jgi:hypothetical protein
MNSKPLYFIGFALLANAAIFTYSHFFPSKKGDLLLDRAAFAQALPASNQMLGFYIMDVDSGTVTVYRVSPENSRLRLMAARSFRNDRFLEDYNNDGITPRDVQKLVAQQHERVDLNKRTDQPTVDQSPKQTDENAPDAPAK